MNRRIGRIFLSAVLATASLLAAQASHAHHGWGEYDDRQPMTLKARVVELSYTNPHASVVIEAGGKRWHAVLAPLARMEFRGASRQALDVGQEITVVGYPSRSAPGEMRVERLVLGERTVELR